MILSQFRMIHIDPLTLGRRVDLLKQYDFGGVALYDYYQVSFHTFNKLFS